MKDNKLKRKIHPFAAPMPPMRDRDYERLKRRIAEEGQRFPIVLLDGMILDGWNRYRACIELGIKPRFRNFTKADGSPLAFVLDCSTRREMTDGMRCVAAEGLMDQIIADRKARKLDISGRASEYAADCFGVGREAVEQVRTLRKAKSPLYCDVRAGRLEVGQAIIRHRRAVRAADIQEKHATANVSIDDCQLLLGDNIELMRKMPAGSYRVIISDPPYNCGWKYRSDPQRDRLPESAYLASCEAWMSEAARLLTDDGSLFVVIDGNYSDHFGILLRKVGLHRQKMITWWESFGVHNSAESTLSNAARYVHYYSKSPRPLFNNIEFREPSDRAIGGDKRAAAPDRIPANVWKISRVQGNNKERVPPAADNPPQLPVELPERCILLASEPGDTIFDPFNGNGTSAVAAIRNRRRYVGIDRDPVYIERSRQWIAGQLAETKEKAA